MLWIYINKMCLQGVRKKLLNYFESSNHWIPWCWVKSEWLREKKEGRVKFLQKCKENSVIPKFIANRLRFDDLFSAVDHRVKTCQHRFGFQLLSMVIRKEIQERKMLRQRAAELRNAMWSFTREEYLFVRAVRDRVVFREMRASERRLNKKWRSLIDHWDQKPHLDVRTVESKDRVVSIETTLTEPEKVLLSKGPKFVPTKGRLTGQDLKELESEIETTACALRREQANAELRQSVHPGKSVDNENSSQETSVLAIETSILVDPKIRRTKLHCAVKQPEKMDFDNERRMSNLKANIMDAYRKYKPTKWNVTKEETKALSKLREREVTIKCSDKSKSLVVMSEEEYIKKAEMVLADTSSYEVIDMTAERLEEKLEKMLKSIPSLKDRLPPDVYRGLFSKGTTLPEFYGLPKIHKPTAPLRPVVAAFDGPLTALSILLERVINQMLEFVSAHIKNTQAATHSIAERFPDLKIPKGTILVTMDVVALYPSIPVEDGVIAVMEKLDKHEDDIDLLGLAREDIRTLLCFVLNNNYFRFGKTVYRQKKGVAMGSHLAPPLAIVFMDRLEQKMLETSRLKPEFYDRYVDDCLLAWTHGEEKLRDFINHCNSQHPSITFTWESTLETNPLPYMDIAILVSIDNRIEYELYQKPSDSGVNLNFASSTPKSLKMSVATEQFRRAVTLSSNKEAETRSVGKIKVLLKENGYTLRAIETAFKRSKGFGKHPRKSQGNTSKVPMKLPFRSDELDKQVRKLVKQSGLNIRVVYTKGQNIKQQLVRSALFPKKCTTREKFQEQQSLGKRLRGKPRDDCVSCLAGLHGNACEIRGAVYSLTCDECGAQYIGETQRPLKLRIKEHHLQAKNRTNNTPWGEHMKLHPDTEVGKKPIFKARLLARSEKETTRKIREAIEIRENCPEINRCKGWTLN